MINLLNTELLITGAGIVRIIHIPLILAGIWALYMIIETVFGLKIRKKTKKVKTIAEAQALVKQYLGSKFMLFPPGPSNTKYTITYNAGGVGDINVAIARGKDFKAVFEIARDWVSNNYVSQQLGEGYFVLLPDAGNDFKYIILNRPKGSNSGEIIATGTSLQDSIENAFLVLNSGGIND